MENRTSILLLPSEIITKIFLLLPLESALACKLVSIEWNSLLADSNFIKLYKYKADSVAFFLHNGVLNCLFQNKDGISYEPCRIPKQISPYEDSSYTEVFPESSNKIACVRDSCHRFLLYNLFTGDLRVVDDALGRSYVYSNWSFLGFGYDPYGDDYKLVVICKSKNRQNILQMAINGGDTIIQRLINEGDRNRNLISIYSYKTGSWKHREGFEDDENKFSMDRNPGIAVNGVLHWIVERFEVYRHIVGLDLNSYRLVEFELPPIFQLLRYINLTTFNGKLCCFVGLQCEAWVWVMEEYGVAESWEMLLRIRASDHGFDLYDFQDTKIYEDRDTGEIIVFIHNQIKFKLFGFDAANEEKLAYVKTLNPKSDNKIQVEKLENEIEECM